MADDGTLTAGSLRDETAAITSVDARMREAVERRGLPGNLKDAVVYALLGPGKRVRPVMVIRGFEAVREPTSGYPVQASGLEHAVTAAAAVEMIHAFSLIHDDLPAMDDDDLRRGRPTLHRHTDEATAILAGDVLQSLAFEILSVSIDDPRLSQRLSAELSAATTDMIAGQVCDTLGDAASDRVEMEKLVATHRLKTGALLCSSCRMGARCGGATEEQLKAITAYADAVGLMFQAVDDLLDVTADAHALGKATRKDADAGKLTYPGLLGVDGTRAEIDRLRLEALRGLESFGPSADPLRELAQRLATRTR